ncbi:caspase, EACC1-associated type [Micromonospora sp. CA-263727]|uniref:caspase, EACC1-associated type n=1 Tax=Micromonospora sp. CA-263727 TaxID=3239967 RepID=UPI003D938E21
MIADPQLSVAIIAGTYRQDAESDFRDLPAVRNNVAKLGRHLRDPEVWGLPAGRCHERLQPRRDELLELVSDAAASARDTLVFYFAGHGFIHPRTEDLYLALAGARRDRGFGTKAVRFKDLQAALQEPSVEVRHKVIILDCCFAAAAFGDEMGVEDVDHKLRTRGSCLLVSSDADRTSKAPEGAEYTAYTGELIATLEQGVAGGGELLTLQTIHEHVEERLIAARMPRPRMLGVDVGGAICIARNRAPADRAVPPQPAAPTAETPLDEALSRVLAEKLTPSRRIQLGHALSWKLLPDYQPHPGERLMALIDDSWPTSRATFLAFTTRALILRSRGLSGAVTSVLSLADLRRAELRLRQRNPVGNAVLSYLQTAGTRRAQRVDRVNGLDVVVDDRPYRVPDSTLGPRATEDLIAEIRAAVLHHGHG